MRRWWPVVLAACGWSQIGPQPNPHKWRSCGPNCRQPAGAPEPDCRARGTAEFATWLAPSLGTRLAPNAPALGLSLGTEATFPLAFDDDLRIGPWTEIGGDSLDLVRARGGLSVLVGGLHDPGFVGRLAGTHDEGAIGLRLGAGWRGVGLLDATSDGAQLEAKLTYGSRRYTEIYESYNAYGVCEDGRRVGHFGPGFAYGHRVFVELERSLDAPATQLIVGVEIDPATAWFANRAAHVRPL